MMIPRSVTIQARIYYFASFAISAPKIRHHDDKINAIIYALWIPFSWNPSFSPRLRRYELQATIQLFHHSNRTTLSLDSEALEGRLPTGWD